MWMGFGFAGSLELRVKNTAQHRLRSKFYSATQPFNYSIILLFPKLHSQIPHYKTPHI